MFPIQVVSTRRRRYVSCIGDKIVASLSLVCCWIQRDTSRPFINMYYVTDVQSASIPNEQLVSIDMYPSSCMYPDTSCSSGIHVSGWHVSWCKRSITVALMCFCRQLMSFFNISRINLLNLFFFHWLHTFVAKEILTELLHSTLKPFPSWSRRMSYARWTFALSVCADL